MGDIFGACVDHQEGASIDDIWKVHEGVYTPGQEGDALRYMNDPRKTGGFDADYYPNRYRGWDDNRGVHWNAGK